MKLNKKGFTLVELIAVIALLGIIIVMLVPNVLEQYRDAHSKTSKAEVQSLWKAAEESIVSNAMKNKSISCFGNSASEGKTAIILETSGNSSNIHYYIETENSMIKKIYAYKDGNACYYGELLSEIKEADDQSDCKTKAVTECSE